MLTLSLVSFNTLGAPLRPWTFKKGRNVRRRFHGIGRELQRLSPDIICLQEVFTHFHLRILRKYLSSLYPNCYFTKHLFGPKGGLVIFSRLPMEDIRFITFENKGSLLNLSVYGHIVRMGMLICRVAGYPIHIINTHFIGNFDHVWSESNRFGSINHAQLQQLGSFINALAAKNNFVIIAGDLNIAKRSHFYKMFVDLTKAEDVFSRFSFPTLHQELFTTQTSPERIDYLFIKPKRRSAYTLSQRKHLFTEKFVLRDNSQSYLSDHIGLSATFQFSA